MEYRFLTSSEDLVALSGKILVITGCSKTKLGSDDSVRAHARDMYKGRLFKKVRKYCELKGFPYLIISAKYGLLHPEDTIKGYEQIIRTKSDVLEARKLVIPRLKTIIDNYDTILVITGEKYRQVLQELWDNRFVFLKSRGYLLMAKVVDDAIKMIESD